MYTAKRFAPEKFEVNSIYDVSNPHMKSVRDSENSNTIRVRDQHLIETKAR